MTIARKFPSIYLNQRALRALRQGIQVPSVIKEYIAV
jgi:hypothetical protein